MSNEGLHPGQLQLFEEGSLAERQAAEEQAATAERARRVAEIAVSGSRPVLDPELDDILIRNRQDGAGFSVRTSERSVQTPTEAGENTRPRPKARPRRPRPPTSARGKAFADLSLIPEHELQRRHAQQGWQEPEERQTPDKPAA